MGGARKEGAGQEPEGREEWSNLKLERYVPLVYLCVELEAQLSVRECEGS